MESEGINLTKELKSNTTRARMNIRIEGREFTLYVSLLYPLCKHEKISASKSKEKELDEIKAEFIAHLCSKGWMVMHSGKRKTIGKKGITLRELISSICFVEAYTYTIKFLSDNNRLESDIPMTVGEIVSLAEIITLMRGDRVVLPSSIITFNDLETVAILEDMGFSRRKKRIKY